MGQFWKYKILKMDLFNLKLIEIILSKSKKVKYFYIFDSYLREEHQEPNDYARFTISGLKHLMLK